MVSNSSTDSSSGSVCPCSPCPSSIITSKPLPLPPPAHPLPPLRPVHPLPHPLPSSSSSVASHLPSPPPFIISIGSGFDHRHSLVINGGGHQQQNQQQEGAKKPDEESRDNAKVIRRQLIGGTMVGLILLVGVVASLALSTWLFIKMDEQEQMYYRVIEGQAERMDRMENAMRKVKVREEQLETELEQLNRVLEEQYRQKAKDHYEVRPLATSAPTTSLPNSSTATTTDHPKDAERDFLAPPNSMGKGIQKRQDFVIYVNGRPMSGKEFMAYGPRGKNDE